MILKLKEAGEEATLAIASADIEKGQYGEQVKFVTVSGDVLYAPLASVVRQLDRIGVADIPEIAGRIIHVSRSASNKPGASPYWNFSKATADDVRKSANGNGAAKSPPAKPVSNYETPLRLPGEAVGGFDGLVEKYRECVQAASNIYGDNINDQALVAAAATLLIQREKSGV